MIDRDNGVRTQGKKGLEFPKYGEDLIGFYVASYQWIESCRVPNRLIPLLALINKHSYECKVAGKLEEEAQLLALKREALMKLFLMRGEENSSVRISSYFYRDEKIVKQRIIFSIKRHDGRYYATEAPLEAFGSKFQQDIEYYDPIPPGVRRRKIDGLPNPPKSSLGLAGPAN